MIHVTTNETAVVTGASGQDGFFLTERLLREGLTIFACVRRADSMSSFEKDIKEGKLILHEVDLRSPDTIAKVICDTKPREFYHLGGETSVSASFENPRNTWRVNVEALSVVLEAVRTGSPETRVYHASSSEMFGFNPGGVSMHDEHSALDPQSPYAASKAAAHLLCKSYRKAYDLRIACGILFNHESYRRAPHFLTQKVVGHVYNLMQRANSNAARSDEIQPLVMGNLKAQRDWGYAPDYVDGIVRILRQIDSRASTCQHTPEPDIGRNYTDYVLGTGTVHPVWYLIDRAFSLAGFDLAWHLSGHDPTTWVARFKSSGLLAVSVEPRLLRPTDPLIIQSDPSKAFRELGWKATHDVDYVLEQMLSAKAQGQLQLG